jgi:hypothetical protein
LKGKYVGVEELGNGIWRIYYYGVFLGDFDDLNIREEQRISQNVVYLLIFKCVKHLPLRTLKPER